jgi:hypothetical protein
MFGGTETGDGQARAYERENYKLTKLLDLFAFIYLGYVLKQCAVVLYFF